MISFYREFFDIHNAGNFATQTFIRELKLFLNETYKIPLNRALTIAQTLCQSMSNDKLYYHTPVHILCMMDAAREHHIELKSWEKLAIWFHDSIYDVKNSYGENERLSAAMLTALMTPYVSDDDLYLAGNAILTTAKHLDKNVPKTYQQLLDLDLISFSFDREQYQLTTDLIRREYETEPIEFNKGRLAFLTKLVSKGTVYRTQFFQDNFEQKAQKNIQEDLQDLIDYV